MLGNLTLQFNFGVKRFQTFRKKLPLDYKKGDRHSHKNTHAMPLPIKDKLLKVVLLSRLRQRRVATTRPFENENVKV